MPTKSRRKTYKIRGNKSFCKGKRTSNPNKCKKIKYCKVARGKKRTYCRKNSAKRLH